MRIGTIGSGKIVEDFLKALTEVKEKNNVKCTAMLATRPKSLQRTQDLGSKYSITNIFENSDEFFSSQEFDFVYIASPNSLHFSYALKALESGKNVLCEKPFTSNSKEALFLIEKAIENNLMIFEMMTTIYFPNYISIKEKIKELGKIDLVQCNFSHVSSKYAALLSGGNPNVFNLEMSGGTLVDMNIYNLHFVLNLFGKPNSVKYYANFWTNGIDISGMVILQYSDIVAVCSSSKNSRSKNMILIQGENGYILIDSGSNFIDKYKLVLGNEEVIVNIQPQKERLFFELDYFCDIFQRKDYTECYEILNYTLMASEVIEKARKSANIIFPADL